MKPSAWIPLFAFITLIGITSPLFAQDQAEKTWNAWSINLNGGLSLFYGDIENYTFYKSFENNNEYRAGFGGMLQKEFNPYMTLRGQLYYGELSGTKRKANIWFEGDVFETSLSLKLDFLNTLWGVRERKFSVYGMLGIGWANWSTELKDLQTNEVLDENGNNKTGSGVFGKTIEPVVPMGLGVDYNISERWILNLEGSLRPVKSDKLDAKVGELEYDFYSYNFIGISYRFVPKKEELPVIEEPVIAVKDTIVEEVPVVVKETVVEPVIEEEPVVEEEEPVEEIVETKPPVEKERTLEEKLLDAESRTGMYDSPWPGVEFTVQIAASKTISDPVIIEKKFGLSGDVSVNQGDGWYRFSVGRYIKYWRAREYRNILMTRNDIQDAFVVAYKEGNRIMLADLVKLDETARKETERPSYTKAFSVQVMATTDRNIPVSVVREMYEIDMEVFKDFNKSDNVFQYTVGNFDTYEEAAKLRNKLKARGLRGAFVVGYKNGVRVSDLKSILD